MHKTSSPYLKELYKGKIKWMPFNIRTLKHALHTDKIIFTHIGRIADIEARERAYALFRNPQVIEIINSNFIPIAIDLEDVPEAMLIGMDLLIITDQYHSLPINIFSLPGGKPFTSFSGISPDSFINIANNVITSFSEKRELLNKAGKIVSKRLEGTGIVLEKQKPYPITHKLLHAYVRSWLSRYVTSRKRQRETPYTINSRYFIFLLKYCQQYKRMEELEFIRKALDKVYFSPIFDPIEGGLFSQADDNTFATPLYEKELSENIQAAVLYSFAYKYFKKPIYKEAVLKIISCIENCFKAYPGGYITSITLTKYPHLSTYYKYSTDEIKKAFPKNYLYIISILGMDETLPPNEQQTIRNTGAAGELTQSDITKLKKIRGYKRSELINDPRVITAYNCLYATSLCLIANNLQENMGTYIEKAQEIIGNILEKRGNEKTRLYRYISKQLNEQANADLLDYSFFLNALLHIYRYTKEERYNKLISQYTMFIMLNYYKSSNGMFCKTPKNEHITPFKRESVIDYIRYSANSVMARNLWILYRTRKDDFYLKTFEQQLYSLP